MRRCAFVLFLLSVSACGGNDSTSPSLTANMVSTGALTTTGCFITATPTLGSCLTFNGTAQNQGPGCATSVRGVVTTYVNVGNNVAGQQVGSAPWTYTGPTVRPNETIAFTGGPLTVGVPVLGGWVYVNNVTFSSVKCP